jgi:hypothetical protein
MLVFVVEPQLSIGCSIFVSEGGTSLSEVRVGNINELLDTVVPRKFGTMLWL